MKIRKYSLRRFDIMAITLEDIKKVVVDVMEAREEKPKTVPIAEHITNCPECKKAIKEIYNAEESLFGEDEEDEEED